MKLKKIYILGTSGSGKSYLAKKLSDKLKIKTYDLDNIFWEKKYTKKLDYNKRVIKIKKLLKKKEWIMEGIYTDWSIDAIKKSDIVIWLDIPFRIRFYRIIKRHLIRKYNNISVESLSDLINLLKYSSEYKRINNHSACYSSHYKTLNENKIKSIILKNNKEIKTFIRELI